MINFWTGNSEWLSILFETLRSPFLWLIQSICLVKWALSGKNVVTSHSHLLSLFEENPIPKSQRILSIHSLWLVVCLSLSVVLSCCVATVLVVKTSWLSESLWPSSLRLRSSWHGCHQAAPQMHGHSREKLGVSRFSLSTAERAAD